MELLEYAFFRNALFGCLLTAVVCGLVGTYIVSRRLVFISGGITHASFGGLGLGFYLGISPVLSALVFAVMSALGVAWVSRSHGLREDSAIAGIWSLGMALGVIFVSLSPGYAPDMSAYLFGNILMVTETDIIALASLAVLLLIMFAFGGREIVYVAFDPDFAHTGNLPVRLIEYILMCMVAVTIVLSIRLVGIMLLMSMLTLPQTIMNMWCSDFKKIAIGSVVIGFLGSVAGLCLSYTMNVPSGAFIILIYVVMFLVSAGVKSRRQEVKKLRS